MNACEEKRPVLTTGEQGRIAAAFLIAPEIATFRTLMATEPEKYAEQLHLTDTLDVLKEQAAAINRGDLARAEAMLMSQATSLQSLFARLVEKAMTGATLPTFETNMRMALRAQAQCRATLETLANVKNPPVVFARQANVTTGPQQVNNHPVARARPREIETEPTQLSGEISDGLRQDAGTPGFAGGINPQMETVGEIHRAEIRGRKTPGGDARLQRRKSPDAS